MNTTVANRLEAFFADRRKQTVLKGKIIFFPDEDPDGILYLLSGAVEQYSITPEGNRVTVNVYKPPAFFPMSWAINHTENKYFYEAMQVVTYKKAPAPEVVQFLKENPDVMFDLLGRVFRGTDALLQRMVLSARGVASGRLMYELLIEASRFGHPVDNTHQSIEIRQASLASLTGLARETVSRELHKLEKKGLLTIGNGTLTLQMDALEKEFEAQNQ